MDWNWTSFASGFFLAVIPSYILYLYKKKDKERLKVDELIDEVRHNLKVSKRREAWLEYSLARRESLTGIREKIGIPLYRQIESLYMELETANQGIRRMRTGNWADELYEKYYGDFKEKILEVLAQLVEV